MPTNVSAEAGTAASQANQCTLATRRATTAQIAVLRVPSVSNDVVDGLTTHQSMRHRSLAVQGCAHLAKFLDYLTLVVALLSCARLTLEIADPAYIAHMGVHAAGSQSSWSSPFVAVQNSPFDMELILQTDR